MVRAHPSQLLQLQLCIDMLGLSDLVGIRMQLLPWHHHIRVIGQDFFPTMRTHDAGKSCLYPSSFSLPFLFQETRYNSALLLFSLLKLILLHAAAAAAAAAAVVVVCLLYTSPSPRDRQKSRMPSSA